MEIKVEEAVVRDLPELDPMENRGDGESNNGERFLPENMQISLVLGLHVGWPNITAAPDVIQSFDATKTSLKTS